MNEGSTALEAYKMLLDVSPVLATIVLIVVAVASVGIFIVSMRSKKLAEVNADNSDTISDTVLKMLGQLDLMNKNAAADRARFEQQLITTKIKVQSNSDRLEYHNGKLEELDEMCKDCVKKVMQ